MDEAICGDLPSRADNLLLDFLIVFQADDERHVSDLVPLAPIQPLS